MKVEEIIQIQKFFFMLFNAFFVILGVSIFGCAAWILFDTNSFIEVISLDGDVRLVAACLAIIGLMVVGVSVLGCAGGQLESKCLLMFYMGFLIAIALGQIFMTFILLVQRKKIERFLVNQVDKTIEQYGGNETDNQVTWTLLDKVQRSEKCCGRQNSADWGQNAYIQSLSRDDVYPCSCFNRSMPCPPYLTVNGTEIHRFGMGNDTYTGGCQARLTSWLEENIAVIIGMDVGLLIVQVLQFTFVVFIYQNIGRKMRQKDSTNLIGSMEVDPQTETVYQDGNPDYDDQDYQQQDYQQQQYNQQNNQQQQYNQQDYQQHQYF
ncbi:leukocyte antigen CD37 [Clupea harengus]|uniref:Leukocyte antigen CD37 n=1 Tax=Clupea harengus TaxID=7950 RepID=A0A6P8GHC7_CLUHA|nr:leukocyte antigen CD37 [Clupea harengus]XP_042566072.1 leukocyte antigen CD37 [Clupea harengus]